MRRLATLLLVSLAAAAEDYYKILDVPRDIDESELKSRFRRRSLQLHPDKNPNDPNAQDKFRQLQIAYEVLKDSKKRKYYNYYGDLWEDMMTYKQEKLKTYQRQQWMEGNMMYYRDVEVDVEEPFWKDKSVRIMHQSFAAKYLPGYHGVWILFAYNPNCGPCKQMIPKVKALGKYIQGSKYKDRVLIGTVNMESQGNHEMLSGFGKAAESIPQIIFLTPNQNRQFSDFEIFDMNTGESQQSFQDRVIQNIEHLEKTGLKLLNAATWSKDVMTEAAGVERKDKWLIFVSGPKCNSCSKQIPVFRRLAEKNAGSGLQFRLVDCEGEHPDGTTYLHSGACETIRSFPTLFSYDPAKKVMSTMPLYRIYGESSREAKKYGYDQQQLSFQVYLKTLVSERKKQAWSTSPRSLDVAGLGQLDGQYARGPHDVHGRPYWKKDDKTYCIWSEKTSRWVISESLVDDGKSFAYYSEDLPTPPNDAKWQKTPGSTATKPGRTEL